MRRRSVITTIIFRATIVFGATAAGDAEARLDVYVDKSTQRMQVIENGSVLYVWPVSTGRDRFSTPSGVYSPERLERSWFSKAYYNAPMPHAIFFHNGYAIHGSYDIARLGGPASHGCIRLHPRNAAVLFSMVQQEGPGNTTIFVGGNSRSPALRYRDDDQPWRPGWRGDAPAARDYPPEPRIGARGPERGPAGERGPAVERMPPGEGPGRYVDRGGSYPPRAPEVDYYVPAPDRYDSADRYYGPDRYAGQGGYPRAPEAAPYDDADRYMDRRRVPRGPRSAPDYTTDPYVDGRGAPRGPGYSPYYPDRRSDARSASPHGPKAPPYDADHYADGQSRRRNDAGPSPLAMRGGDPAARLPAPRYDGPAPAERTTGERMPVERMPVDRTTAGRVPVERIPVPRSFRPVVGGAKPRPIRPADEPPPDYRMTPGDVAGVLPPMPPSVLPPTSLPPTSVLPPVVPPAPTPAVSSAPAARQEPPSEPQDSGFGYKILPRSYWAGASWRWRLKREDDGAAPPASQ